VVFPAGTVTDMAPRDGFPMDGPDGRRRRAGVALLSAALLVGVVGACARNDGPEAIARSLVEQYYVHPDLPKAKTLTHGLARRKIEEGERLIRGVMRTADEGIRTVSYSLYTTRKVGEDRIFFVYDLSVSVDRLVMKKRTFISTTKVEEGWRVTNFQEEDLQSEAPHPPLTAYAGSAIHC
jgi:hypothetical protein